MNIRSLVILIYSMALAIPAFAAPISSSLNGSDIATNRVPLIQGMKILGHDFNAAVVEQLKAGGVKAGSGTTNSYLRIEQGNVLLSPDRDIVVGTRNGDLHISSGATVFIMALSNGDIVLYDLRQSGNTQVRAVVSSEDQIVMEPGYMLVLTRDSVRNFEELSPACHSIYYLEPQVMKMTDKEIKAFIAEFSYKSAMQKVQPLKDLILSTDRQDKVILDRILKTAVILGDFSPPPNGLSKVASSRNKEVRVSDTKGPQL